MDENLTSQELVAIEALGSGAKSEETRRLAGLGKTEDVAKVILSPSARRYAKRMIKGRIDIEASPQAYRKLLKIMHSEQTPLAIQVDIAKFFVSHSVVPKKQDKSDDNQLKDLNEMSNSELMAFIKQSDVIAEKRGVLIDATPVKSLEDML